MRIRIRSFPRDLRCLIIARCGNFRGGPACYPPVSGAGDAYMGIRFTCPNGHDLHAKDVQKGKIVYCTKCQVPVRVPEQSTRESRHKHHRGGNDDSLVPGEAQVHVGSDTPGETSPQIVSPRDGDFSNRGTDSAAGAFGASGADIPGAQDVPPVVAPPIVSTPSDYMWKVRGIDGSEYGPISDAVLQEWIRQNRVGSDMLVWRSGWSEWRKAVEIFPKIADMFSNARQPPLQVASPQTVPAPVIIPDTPAPNVNADSIQALEMVADDTSRNSKLEKKRRKARRELAMVFVLLAVILVLLGVLLAILMSQGGGKKSEEGKDAPITSVSAIEEFKPLVSEVSVIS